MIWFLSAFMEHVRLVSHGCMVSGVWTHWTDDRPFFEALMGRLNSESEGCGRESCVHVE